MDRNKIIKRPAVVIAIFLLPIFIFLIIPVNKGKLLGVYETSRRIYDRNGVLLREIPSSEYGVSQWISLQDIPPYTLQAFIVKEDKRFYSHIGIDFNSALRALKQNIEGKKIVSGASTITMQASRLSYSIRGPKILKKFFEILYALKLELYLTKSEILEIYLNRTPFGNNVYGINAASYLYYKKSPKELSILESAVLASIPQGPSIYNPYVNYNCKKMGLNILNEMKKGSLISDEIYNSAVLESLSIVKEKSNFLLPHLCDRAVYELRGRRWIKAFTSADYALQSEMEDIIKTSIEPLAQMNVTNGAIIIADGQTGDILVMIGSKDYFSDETDGQFNACYGMRSPGSALKPFTYALGLLNGYNASSIITDEPTYFKEAWGDFKPENYDFKFHGEVTFRQALACSYNVPACKVLDSIGTDKLYSMLQSMNFEMHKKGPDAYGIALTLGSMSVSLFELVSAYTVFVNKGSQVSPQILDSALLENGKIIRFKNNNPKKIMPEWTSYIIGNILSDNDARYPAFDKENPFKFKYFVGAKTGTSKNYKDNFALGFTGKYVIGVWVGNNDESPMVGVSGMTGAGPLFRNAVMTLSKSYEVGEYPSKPSETAEFKVCKKSGMPAGDNCEKSFTEILHIDALKKTCTQCNGDNVMPAKIKYPDNGDVFVIDADLDLERQVVEILFDKDIKDFAVTLDLDTLKKSRENKKIYFHLQKGVHTIKILNGSSIIDNVIFSVK